MSRAIAWSGWLALGTLGAVVFMPPEAYGSGGMFLLVGSTFAFLILVALGGVPNRYLSWGLGGMGALALHSLVLSYDVYRSFEFLATLWSYYCLFGALYYGRTDMRWKTAGTLVLAGTAVAAYGVYQSWFGLGQLYQYVLYSGAEDIVRIPILDRVESGRIFSTFALPGTLWGYLIVTLPLHALLWPRASKGLRALLVANAGLTVYAAILTQSYGVVVGFGTVALGWFLTRPGNGNLIKRAVLVGLVLAPVAAGIYSVRTSTYNPVTLRIQNWLSGWEIFASNPLGSGLNSYAVLYMQHQQLRANETQFAHNTPVQLLGELGLIAVAVTLAGAIWLVHTYPRWVPDGEGTRYLLIALMVWGAHNLIEINVYFSSIGTIGVALLAVLLWQPGIPLPGKPPDLTLWSGAAGAAGLVALVLGGGMFVSGELLHRSRVEIENRELDQASGTLAQAAFVNPFNSTIFHEAGQVSLELYHATGETYRIEDARTFFRRAIELSPRKVGPYVGYALTLSTLDQTEASIEQLRIAQRLHPAGDQSYAIRRLIERRHLELAGTPRE